MILCLPRAAIVAVMASGLLMEIGAATAQDRPATAPDEPAAGQPAPSPDAGGANLQEQAQNPIASLISVPFQNNFNFRVGELNRTQYVLNFQPVYPLKLNEDWNVIIRPILPVINRPKLFDGDTSEFGLGDLTPQLFFTPSAEVPLFGARMTWGVGPTLQFPTATDDSLGTQQWSAGPGAVAVVTRTPWLFGALINNIWSFAGKSDREDVNLLTLQPFVNYNLPDGWSIGTGPIITANWKADSGDVWTVPLGGGPSKLFRIGKQSIQANLRAYYNAIRPDNAAEWQLQFQLTFLFPK